MRGVVGLGGVLVVFVGRVGGLVREVWVEVWEEGGVVGEVGEGELFEGGGGVGVGVDYLVGGGFGGGRLSVFVFVWGGYFGGCVWGVVMDVMWVVSGKVRWCCEMSNWLWEGCVWWW